MGMIRCLLNFDIRVENLIRLEIKLLLLRFHLDFRMFDDTLGGYGGG